jgi:hypothetical protein
MISAYKGYMKIVDLLLKFNPEVHLQDKFGKRAIERAKTPEIAFLIQTISITQQFHPHTHSFFSPKKQQKGKEGNKFFKVNDVSKIIRNSTPSLQAAEVKKKGGNIRRPKVASMPLSPVNLNYEFDKKFNDKSSLVIQQQAWKKLISDISVPDKLNEFSQNQDPEMNKGKRRGLQSSSSVAVLNLSKQKQRGEERENTSTPSISSSRIHKNPKQTGNSSVFTSVNQNFDNYMALKAFTDLYLQKLQSQLKQATTKQIINELIESISKSDQTFIDCIESSIKKQARVSLNKIFQILNIKLEEILIRSSIPITEDLFFTKEEIEDIIDKEILKYNFEATLHDRESLELRIKNPKYFISQTKSKTPRNTSKLRPESSDLENSEQTDSAIKRTKKQSINKDGITALLNSEFTNLSTNLQENTKKQINLRMNLMENYLHDILSEEIKKQFDILTCDYGRIIENQLTHKLISIEKKMKTKYELIYEKKQHRKQMHSGDFTGRRFSNYENRHESVSVSGGMDYGTQVYSVPRNESCSNFDESSGNEPNVRKGSETTRASIQTQNNMPRNQVSGAASRYNKLNNQNSARSQCVHFGSRNASIGGYASMRSSRIQNTPTQAKVAVNYNYVHPHTIKIPYTSLPRSSINSFQKNYQK